MHVDDLEGSCRRTAAISCPRACRRPNTPRPPADPGQRVHIINGREDDGLLAEVFSNDGIGTLIHANEYQPDSAREEEGPARHPGAHAQGCRGGRARDRSRASLEKSLGDFYIFEIDRNPVACVALHVDAETRNGELACLYVSPAHEHQGIGRKLVQFVEARARELGLDKSSRSPPRPSCSSSRRADSPRARADDLRPPGARNTTGAAASRRCSSRP